MHLLSLHKAEHHPVRMDSSSSIKRRFFFLPDGPYLSTSTITWLYPSHLHPSRKVVVGTGGASAAKGSSYLGRPWGDYARVVFQNSNLNSVITSAGWMPWNSAQVLTNVYFAEYANTNAAGSRVSWAKMLSSAYGIGSILPSYNSWVDSVFLGLSAA